jgi:hypothetical protein
MQSGEDIMASMIEHEDDTVQLDDPMRLVFRRLPTGQTIMMMMPWLPIELIKLNSATVYTSDIITMVEPKEAMIEYYDRIVQKLVEDMADSDEMLQSLLDQQDEEDEPKYEADDGALTESQLEQLLKDIKTNKLH